MRKKIILASASPQRRRLMTLLGVPFSVKPSRAKELTEHGRPCPYLVKKNALRKAREVARRTTKGIVIGADTLVTLGHGRIVGKPGSLAEAKRNLRELFRRPSWVYTGIALIDAASGQALCAYEKTKVFMYPLTDKEIDRYYSQMSPLDKAGGFDIEGKGSHFIHRIEGCYFNVVGLPVARLVQMLKRMGVRILGVLICLYLSGCATEYNLATGQQESLIYTTEKEVAVGNNIARRFEQEMEIAEEEAMNRRVREIFDKLVEVCDRKDIVYRVKVVEDDRINAVSLPGGYVYVFSGLVENVENDDQLACVLAHEIGHITARHSVKKIQGLYGFSLLKVLAVQSGSGQFVRGMDLAFAAVFTEYAQEDEFLADELGIKYAQAAGFDPKGMAGFLKRMKELQEKEGLMPLSYFRTHPFVSERIANANQEVRGHMEFRDYLNLMGE